MENQKAKKFWDRVSQILDEQKYTFTALMKSINRPLRTGIGWNVNSRMPPADAAQDIADALGVSVRFLLTGEKEENQKIASKDEYLRNESDKEALDPKFKQTYEVDFKNKDEFEKFLKFVELLNIDIEILSKSKN